MDKIETKEHYFEIINEKYSRIGKKLEFLWGTEDFNLVIHKLINDSRNGTRSGFPAKVADALLKLHKIHTSEKDSI